MAPGYSTLTGLWKGCPSLGQGPGSDEAIYQNLAVFRSNPADGADV